MKVKCLNCFNEIESIRTGTIEGVRQNKKFCDRSCAASYNNRLYPKRKRIERSEEEKKKEKQCLNCQNIITGWREFCDECHKINGWQTLKQKVYIERWEQGLELGGHGYYLSKTIRKFLLAEANYKCTKCNWSKVHPITGCVPLEINHIDGDGQNHARENVEVLCLNCHGLTPNYRGLNKGNGRPYFRDNVRPKT